MDESFFNEFFLSIIMIPLFQTLSPYFSLVSPSLSVSPYKVSIFSAYMDFYIGAEVYFSLVLKKENLS